MIYPRTRGADLVRSGAATLFFCFALGACGHLRPLVEPKPVSPPPEPRLAFPAPEPKLVAPAPEPKRIADQLEALLEYYAYSRKLTGAELQKEQQIALQAFTQQQSDASRIRLAMLLSHPQSGVRDDARALALLSVVPNDKTASPLPGNFAHLLASYIRENKKLHERLLTLKQKLKEEEEETEALRQKINTLKSLEKGPLDRARSSSRSSPN